MAADTGGCVRLEQRLKVKLGEAKDLVTRNHGSIGTRDVYCVLSLDQEEIFRSATVEKTLDPFFGEEFQFDIPREFRFLSVYVHDRDRPMKTDKIVGKVSIKREDLSKQNGKDQWFALTPVDADSEVQGKVHVSIVLKSLRHVNDSPPQPMIEVKIVECSDLCIVSGACDPYVTVTMHYTNKKQEAKKTKTRKKTVTPQFDETFFFELSPLSGRNNINNHYLQSMSQQSSDNTYNINSSPSTGYRNNSQELEGFHYLQVAVWHDASIGNVFLGEVRIPLKDLLQGREYSAWYLLQPREAASRASSGGSGLSSGNKSHGLGSLRLNLQYSRTHVFSPDLYDKLRTLLVQTATAKPVSSSVGWLLGEICGNNKQSAAIPLTRVLVQHNQAVAFISNLAEHEMSSVTDPNTVFRGNTLTTKCMDELMKLAGHHYLKQTLQTIIHYICKEKKPCEVDPARIATNENRATNLANLCDYTSKILGAINNSALSCPPVMCQIFAELRTHANAIFPNQREVRYSVISGFIFLRFFAPAILGPKLFDITNQQIDSTTMRTLTLISKAVQGVGNLVSSSARSTNNVTTFKEHYMREVFSYCIDNKLVDGARTFLDIISVIPNGNHKAHENYVRLKEGTMIKRAQGRKKFGLKNFKTRFFTLDTQGLSYSKSKSSSPLYSIPVEDILAVEQVQESSFKCKNMFQVVRPTRTLYIQAANCVEEKEWIDLLNKVCKYNKHRLKEYHPGAYLNNHWLCCKASSEHAPGCSAVSNFVDVDLNIQIDAEREMESILSLLLSNVPKLNQLKEICSSQTNSNANEQQKNTAQSTLQLIQKLTTVLQELHSHHISYQAELRRSTRPGSKQAPIGDDNYLLLNANPTDKIVWDTGQKTVATSTASLASETITNSTHTEVTLNNNEKDNNIHNNNVSNQQENYNRGQENIPNKNNLNNVAPVYDNSSNSSVSAMCHESTVDNAMCHESIADTVTTDTYLLNDSSRSDASSVELCYSDLLCSGFSAKGTTVSSEQRSYFFNRRPYSLQSNSSSLNSSGNRFSPMSSVSPHVKHSLRHSASPVLQTNGQGREFIALRELNPNRPIKVTQTYQETVLFATPIEQSSKTVYQSLVTDSPGYSNTSRINDPDLGDYDNIHLDSHSDNLSSTVPSQQTSDSNSISSELSRAISSNLSNPFVSSNSTLTETLDEQSMHSTISENSDKNLEVTQSVNADDITNLINPPTEITNECSESQYVNNAQKDTLVRTVINTYRDSKTTSKIHTDTTFTI